MSKRASDLFCRPHCQPRLSHTARPGQREQGDVGTPQQRLEGGDLPLPPDERSQEPRQGCPGVLLRDEVNHLGRWAGRTVSRRGACHDFHQEPEDQTGCGIVRFVCVAVK
jgi:hypothetical protein